MKIIIDVNVVERHPGALRVRVSNGFGDADLMIANDKFEEVFPTSMVVEKADDFTRLPILMAAAMTDDLRVSAPTRITGRNGWLTIAPKVLLKRLKETVTELEHAIEYSGNSVLRCAASVSNLAMMIADKADKLEPPADGEVVDAEVDGHPGIIKTVDEVYAPLRRVWP